MAAKIGASSGVASRGMIETNELKKTALYTSLSLLGLILLVYGQVHSFEFADFDDHDALLSNDHVRYGLSLDNIAWALRLDLGA